VSPFHVGSETLHVAAEQGQEQEGDPGPPEPNEQSGRLRMKVKPAVRKQPIGGLCRFPMRARLPARSRSPPPRTMIGTPTGRIQRCRRAISVPVLQRCNPERTTPAAGNGQGLGRHPATGSGSRACTIHSLPEPDADVQRPRSQRRPVGRGSGSRTPGRVAGAHSPSATHGPAECRA
jgi:hypothetical protein